ncbi:hypothetical protein FHW16_005807 [Phyllobacterium myrsinacearum]|uniref:Uncharacterized protein n=1 Tax=Phyllobacterium myrsinacearum TaxID=28101 RepID=A0A839ET03_9HYPH|nr:hypothetical protein [Phyllobacterium myrsinacearum]
MPMLFHAARDCAIAGIIPWMQPRGSFSIQQGASGLLKPKF